MTNKSEELPSQEQVEIIARQVAKILERLKKIEQKLEQAINKD